MKQVTTYVGIDAHKKDLFVAMLMGSESKPVTWQLANEPNAVRRFVRKVEREAPGPVHMFYEAGACGYALQRQVTTTRVSCDVVAPALIPRKPGERVKTNRRDACKLAELGRAGLLTAVQPPTPEDEAVRDLARARDDAREDLQRCRHRLGKLLLRRGLHYAGRNWTRAHRQWIDGLAWTHAAERAVVDDYLLAIDHTEARLLELDARLAETAEREHRRAGARHPTARMSTPGPRHGVSPVDGSRDGATYRTRSSASPMSSCTTIWTSPFHDRRTGICQRPFMGFRAVRRPVSSAT
jgi:transposase